LEAIAEYRCVQDRGFLRQKTGKARFRRSTHQNPLAGSGGAWYTENRKNFKDV